MMMTTGMTKRLKRNWKKKKNLAADDEPEKNLNKRATMALVRSPERSRFIKSLPNVKLDLDIVQTNTLVKFHHN
ncbi:hypothetical protein DPMN_041145 [Dreissena polymorpha]|uniref:Uncharacterized protein n=1 Tax=Dreissena polymorpha TaxID=45954 RepID=A0A9D4CWA8_DREPO|nr:hypothetical protein DPMN_041145 [Dreissena polymorpha]